MAEMVKKHEAEMAQLQAKLSSASDDAHGSQVKMDNDDDDDDDDDDNDGGGGDCIEMMTMTMMM